MAGFGVKGLGTGHTIELCSMAELYASVSDEGKKRGRGINHEQSIGKQRNAAPVLQQSQQRSQRTTYSVEEKLLLQTSFGERRAASRLIICAIDAHIRVELLGAGLPYGSEAAMLSKTLRRPAKDIRSDSDSLNIGNVRHQSCERIPDFCQSSRSKWFDNRRQSMKRDPADRKRKSCPKTRKRSTRKSVQVTEKGTFRVLNKQPSIKRDRSTTVELHPGDLIQCPKCDEFMNPPTKTPVLCCQKCQSTVVPLTKRGEMFNFCQASNQLGQWKRKTRVLPESATRRCPSLKNANHLVVQPQYLPAS